MYVNYIPRKKKVKINKTHLGKKKKKEKSLYSEVTEQNKNLLKEELAVSTLPRVPSP